MPAVLDPVLISSGPYNLCLDDIIDVARYGRRVRIDPSPKFRALIERGRAVLDEEVEAGEVVYGVNTGFGGNARYCIPDEELAHHQHNLLEFLCCGVGPPLAPEAVRAAMLLRANALARGLSAVRPIVLEQLAALLNHGITPLVPRFGSVGSSGDLVPSCYIARAMLGMGEVMLDGAHWGSNPCTGSSSSCPPGPNPCPIGSSCFFPSTGPDPGRGAGPGQRGPPVVPAADALRMAGVPPIDDLRAKEGLALLNGTAVMTGVAALVADDAAYLLRLFLGVAAMTAEALRSSPDYYHEDVQGAKHHPGQRSVAAALRAALTGSALAVPLREIRRRVATAEAEARGSHAVVVAAESVQSPYSLRCLPQGLGPAAEGLGAAWRVVEREANSASDNPLVDPATGLVHHTGNFMGCHVARAMDGLKLDLCLVSNWSHALMALLMDDRLSGGLPPSLSPRPGVYQGLKGAQICHTSLVTALRHWAAPSAVHTLPTEQGNQDVVSLGTHAALTAADAVGLLKAALAIHLLAAAQAVDLRAAAVDGGDGGIGDNQKGGGDGEEGRDGGHGGEEGGGGGTERLLGEGMAALYRAVRALSAPLAADRVLDREISALVAAMDAREIPVPRLGCWPGTTDTGMC